MPPDLDGGNRVDWGRPLRTHPQGSWRKAVMFAMYPMHRELKEDCVDKIRVAVIHHNALLREGLCRILEAGDFEVVWQRGDAIDVVHHLDDPPPDVILLEWEVPGVDPSLVRELAGSLRSVAIVIMARPDAGTDLAPALEAGAAGCLSANLDYQDFLAALRLLAQGDMLVSHEMVPAVSNPPAEVGQALDMLTPRELEILRALGRGATNQEIAEELYISPHTVKIHVRRVLAKMDFRNRQQAAAYAAAEGLVSREPGSTPPPAS